MNMRQLSGSVATTLMEMGGTHANGLHIFRRGQRILIGLLDNKLRVREWGSKNIQ
jgi:hypothetical protein